LSQELFVTKDKMAEYLELIRCFSTYAAKFCWAETATRVEYNSRKKGSIAEESFDFRDELSSE